MHWQLCAAILLLLVWQGAPNQIQAARTTNFDILEYWQPHTLKQTQRKSSQQILNPGYEFIQSRIPSDGYNRRRQLPGQGRARGTTTTERPLIRVWNSFLRSVQPNFGLHNLTNPLVNLFSNGNANIIETLPLRTELYNDEQATAEEEEEQQQQPEQSTASKRKRRRRKQQKRRPVFESEEQTDYPYDYYGDNTLPMPSLYYYHPHDYYGLRRLQNYQDYAQPASYYHPYFVEQNAVNEEETDSEYTSTDNLGKLNTKKKVAVLRPLSLAFALPAAEQNTANKHVASSAEANENEDEDEDDSFLVVGSKPEVNVGRIANEDRSTATLSESARNALGTYMRDDIQTRQRQRHSEQQLKVDGASEKAKPRQRQHQEHYILTARLFNNL
ncbi:nuclear control of ATPase protein 2 isoform X2 [Drosophila grimshawi]|uniref:nuclear control of ATPase protein 2 isoform X2 n=1 Tax=Drosophila grimshawi TaxID=7222 RepID=UPI001C931FB9|nr:nuclear control of ATPase protein 2 isoform X2 [Drosophila grimshawi]